MKHLQRLSVSLFVLTMFLFSCDKKTSDVKQESAREIKVKDNALEEHLISVNQGTEMYHEFDENRIKVLAKTLKDKYKNPDFNDTQFIWYALEDLKAYIEYVEAIQKANPKQDVSGLRIYFGAYPDSGKFKDGKKIKLPGQQTVFMVPTVAIEGGSKEYNALNHLPFVINSKATNSLNGDFKIIDDLMNSTSKKERLNLFYKKSQNFQTAGFNTNTFTGSTAELKMIFNEGEMIPPPINN